MRNKPVNFFHKVVMSRTDAAVDEEWEKLVKTAKRTSITIRKLAVPISNLAEVELPVESRLIPCFNHA